MNNLLSQFLAAVVASVATTWWCNRVHAKKAPKVHLRIFNARGDSRQVSLDKCHRDTDGIFYFSAVVGDGLVDARAKMLAEAEVACFSNRPKTK